MALARAFGVKEFRDQLKTFHLLMLRSYLLLLCFFGFAFQVLPQSPAQRAAVLVSATAQNSPARITLNWEPVSGTSSISIYRKLKTGSSWGGAIANPGASEVQYQDNSVQIGVAYEYKVVRSANGVTGTGYIASGIEVTLPDYRGKMILLVDNVLAPNMVSELNQLTQDLKADGWAVIRSDVSRTAPASSIRAIVQGHYNSDPANVKAVYIVGHVPVPYSGNVAPDGHSEHVGAWPCDGYYGEMNGSWSDNSVNNNGSLREANRNVPGDGKFDQSDFPSDVELQVGRVDLYDMPAFSQSEVQLVKNYLTRAHNFKVKAWTPLVRGLMFDNLQWVSNPIAGTGWRNMGPLVGGTNITNANQNGNAFHNLVNGESYLWTYSSGGGNMTWEDGGYTYNGAGNIGTTQNYASNSSMGGVFNMACGSYFGDWDNKNNFLKAPIAKGDALTNVWAGIPAWYFHHMGQGDNIGYSTLLTMNNSSLYTPLTEGWQGSIGRTHLGLMGDPSLRMQMIAPPTSLTVSNSGGTASFNWSASSETVIGYHIYRFSSNGSITRLTTSPVTGTSYQNAAIPFEAGREYMVRAVKLQTNSSGSYYNLSLGALATAAGTASADCAGVVGGGAVPGSPCNDNDPCTINDTWNSNCQCVGSPVTVTASITAAGPTNFCAGGSVVLNANTGSGLSYVWRRDGSTISGATSASYTADQPGVYTVRVNNGSCETTSSGVTVTINSAPSASITAAGPTSFCTGGTVVLNANTGSGLSYVWRRDGTTIGGASSASYTATEAGEYTVRVSNGGCESTSGGVTVSIGSAPSASITAGGPITFCSGGSVQLNANTGSGLSYVWRRDGSTISGATSASYTATQAGVYTVRVSNGGCETTSSGVTVTINSAPSASITAAGPTSFCTGGSVVLNANTGSGLSYVWRRDGSTISGAISASYTATLAGVYTVRVSNAGCETTSSGVTVTINSTPSASITAGGPITFCSGGSVQLNANTGSGFSYVWRRDGNTIGGATSASYTATEAGNYTVRISNNGCEATSSGVTVAINTAPSASIATDGGTDFCSGGSVLLTAITDVGSSYVWRRNGNVIPGASSSSYTAAVSGNYVVEVTNEGCSTSSSPVSVNVSNVPMATITPAGPTDFCSGGNVLLNATEGSDLSYSWQLNGQTISGASSSSYFAAVTGAYSVTVSGNGCSATSAPVTVTTFLAAAPELSVNGDGSICEGAGTEISTLPVDDATYVWSFNGTVLDGEIDAMITADQAGMYSLYILNGSCVSETAQTEITANAAPLVEIVSYGPTSVCTGDTVMIQATQDSVYSYVWMLDGNALADADGSAYAAVLPGAYSVTVDDGDCASTSAPIMVTMIPDVTIAAQGATAFCIGDSVLLTAVADSAYTYSWSRDGVVLENELSHELHAQGTGSYMVTVGSASCSATSEPVEVVASEEPAVLIEAAGPLMFCEGDSVILSTQFDTLWSYQWYHADELIPGATSNELAAFANGAYSVEVTNGGCTIGSGNVVVTTLPFVELELDGPAAFCIGDSVLISAVQGDSYTYSWSLNDSILLADTTHMLIVADAGNYQVVISDGICSASSDVIAISVDAQPEFELSVLGSTMFCAGDSVLLTVATDSLANFTTEWFVDGVAAGVESEELMAMQSGVYTALVSNGGCALSSDSISVITLPQVALTLQGEPVFCEGAEVVLSTLLDSSYTYQWIMDGVEMADENSNELFVISTGTYSVSVQGAGCSATSDTLSLEMLEAPELNCYADISMDMVGVDVLTGAGPFNYMWNDDVALDTTYAPINGSGLYTVTVIDGNGCVETCEVEVIIDTDEDPCSGLRTETQGSWANSTLLLEGFDAAFPDNLIIGCGYRKMRLTSAEAVAAFLPSSGPSQRLPFGTLVDPGNTYGNSLAGELVALKLSVRFDELDQQFSTSATLLQDATVASGLFQGMTVAELIEEADRKIGGCFSWYSRNQLRIALANINNGYAGGTIASGYLDCPEEEVRPTLAEAPEIQVRGTEVETSVFPNPFMNNTTIVVGKFERIERVVIEVLSTDGVLLERLFEGEVTPGNETRVEWNASSRAMGVYYYRVISSEGVMTGRMILQ